ncbi:MAG: DUF1569 domain-containing protein [Pirellulales bacterium]
MTETAQVTGRRKPRFNSFDEVLDDVRSLAAQPTRQLGNWSLGQVCQHLGLAMEHSATTDRLFRVPLWLRVLGRLVRNRALKHGLPTGFKLPPEGAAKFVPPPVSIEQGLATLEKGIAVLSQTSHRAPHPVLGALNVDQWHQFHLRHAEMHLSFIVPD